jgi:hypothetical protein
MLGDEKMNRSVISAYRNSPDHQMVRWPDEPMVEVSNFPLTFSWKGRLT